MNSSLLVIGSDTLVGKHVVRASAEANRDSSVFAFARKDLPLDDLPNLIVDLESTKPAHIVVIHEIDTSVEPMFECADRGHDQMTAILNIYAAASHLGCQRVSVVASHLALGWRDVADLSAENLLASAPSYDAPPATLATRLMLTQNHYYRYQYGIATFFYIYPYLYGDFASRAAEMSERPNAVIDAVVRARSGGDKRLTLGETENWSLDFAYAGDVARAILHQAQTGRTGVGVHPGSRTVSFGQFAQSVAKAAGYAGEIIHGTEEPSGEPRLSPSEADAAGEPPTELDTGLRIALARRAEAQRG
jgi:nucleoside-diphosphate-sugar epimerase